MERFFHYCENAFLLPVEDALKDPLSDCSDILRFLLPLYSPTEIAKMGEIILDCNLSTDDEGGEEECSEDDWVDVDKDEYEKSLDNPYGWHYPRRLHLRAGALFLRPKLLKELNYFARRGALLAFFGRTTTTTSITIVWRIRNNGAGATVLMRNIIAFL